MDGHESYSCFSGTLEEIKKNILVTQEIMIDLDLDLWQSGTLEEIKKNILDTRNND